MKTVIVAALFVFSVVFITTIFTNSDVGGQSSSQNRPFLVDSFVTPGAFEWVIAIRYTLHLLTFWYDLHLSKSAYKGSTALERLPIPAPRSGVMKPTKLFVLRLFVHDDITHPL